MNINTTNYEIYILDYYEGRLTKSEAKELFSFLAIHPDIKAEFDNFEIISLKDATSIKYEFKESLKKTSASSAAIINTTNYKEFFIAAHEGDLNEIQKKQLGIFLNQHPSLNNDYHLFQIAKLTADQTIVFRNKRQLKKFFIFTPISKKLIYQTVSIAASLLIFAGISVYLFTPDSTLNKDITAFNNNNKTFKNSSLKHDNKINESAQMKHILASSVIKTKIIKKNITKETQTPEAIERVTSDIHSLSSLHSVKITTKETGLINEESRNYYTSINQLLAFADEQIKQAEVEQIPDPKKTSRLEIDADLLKDQPLAEAGGFIKNIAVIGYSKIEEIRNTAKDTYLALEEKVSRK